MLDVLFADWTIGFLTVSMFVSLTLVTWIRKHAVLKSIAAVLLVLSCVAWFCEIVSRASLAKEQEVEAWAVQNGYTFASTKDRSLAFHLEDKQKEYAKQVQIARNHVLHLEQELERVTKEKQALILSTKIQ